MWNSQFHIIKQLKGITRLQHNVGGQKHNVKKEQVTECFYISFLNHT